MAGLSFLHPSHFACLILEPLLLSRRHCSECELLEVTLCFHETTLSFLVPTAILCRTKQIVLLFLVRRRGCSGSGRFSEIIGGGVSSVPQVRAPSPSSCTCALSDGKNSTGGTGLLSQHCLWFSPDRPHWCRVKWFLLLSALLGSPVCPCSCTYNISVKVLFF